MKKIIYCSSVASAKEKLEEVGLKEDIFLEIIDNPVVL